MMEVAMLFLYNMDGRLSNHSTCEIFLFPLGE